MSQRRNQIRNAHLEEINQFIDKIGRTYVLGINVPTPASLHLERMKRLKRMGGE